MKRLLLFLAMFVPSIAFAQGGSVNSGAIIVLSSSGRPIGGATVTICASPGVGVPCTNTVTVYTDPTLTTPATNPATSDGNGNVFRYAAPGVYSYTVTGSGISTAGQPFTATVAGAGGGNVVSSSPNTFTAIQTFTQPIVGSITGSAGSIAGGGTLTPSNINNVRFIDGTTFPQTAAGINTADTNCVASTPCVIEVNAPGTYSGAAITLTKNHFLRFRGGGTYVVSGIVGPDSNSDVTGVWGVVCPEHATIQLANASNVDVITSTNFKTLSGTNNSFGTYRWTLQGCTIDANKANQTALVTSGTFNINNVARTGGVSTISSSNTPSPACAAGMTVIVGGNGNLANEISNASYSFNGRFIVQSATATSITYNQGSQGNVGSIAATGTTPIAVCYSGSNGVRIYGRNYHLEDVEIGNAIFDGLWLEGGNTTPFTNLNDILESNIRHLRLINSGGDGFVYEGPQNSHADDISTLNHGQWGQDYYSPIFVNKSVDYLNTFGGTRVGSLGQLFGGTVQPTSAAGIALLFDANSQSSNISTLLAGSSTGIGIELRTAGHVISAASVNNNATGIKWNGGSVAISSLLMSNNTTWFDCTQSPSRSNISFVNIDNIGTPLAANCGGGGDIAFSSFSGNPVLGTSPNANTNTFLLPGTTIGAGGFKQTVPTGVNSTFALLGLAQTFSAAQNFSAAPAGASGNLGFGYDSTTGTEQHNSNNNGASSFSGAWQCTNVTPVTVNANVTTDQNLMACTVPAGTLNRVGRSLRVKVAGIYSTPAASTSQMTVKVKICSVSGCGSGNVLTALSIQSTALGTVQITNDNFSLRGELTAQTAGAALAEEAHGEYLIDLSTLATAADSPFGDTNTATVTGSPSAIDSTAQNFLQVTFAFSAASASNTATQRQLVVETVN